MSDRKGDRQGDDRGKGGRGGGETRIQDTRTETADD